MYEKFAELLEKTNKTAYQVSKDTGIRRERPFLLEKRKEPTESGQAQNPSRLLRREH